MNLSPKRQEIYRFIESYSNQNGYAPTLREIAAAVNLSLSTVYFHTNKLEKDRVLTRTPGQPRTIKVRKATEGGNREQNDPHCETRNMKRTLYAFFSSDTVSRKEKEEVYASLKLAYLRSLKL